jgi:hypothetical protein
MIRTLGVSIMQHCSRYGTTTLGISADLRLYFELILFLSFIQFANSGGRFVFTILKKYNLNVYKYSMNK